MTDNKPPHLAIWIGSLEAYNAGKLIGQWFDLDYPLKFEEELEDWKKAAGLEHHEEFEVFDHEWRNMDAEDAPPLSPCIGEAIEIAELLEAMQDHQHAISYALNHRRDTVAATAEDARDQAWTIGDTREDIARELHGDEVDALGPVIASVVCFRAIAEILENHGKFYGTPDGGIAYCQD